MTLKNRLDQIERAERAEARLIKHHILELAQQYNLPIEQLEAVYQAIHLRTEEAFRLYPNDFDGQVKYVAQQSGIDEVELRAGIEELTRNGLPRRARQSALDL